MLEHKLKTSISWIFLASHFGTFISLIVLTIAGGLETDEAKTVAGLILPLFAVYTTAILKAALADRHKLVPSHKRVNSQLAAIALLIVGLFAIGIPALLYARVASFITTDDLILFLGLVETAFAVYLGLIVDELFGKQPESTSK